MDRGGYQDDRDYGRHHSSHGRDRGDDYYRSRDDRHDRHRDDYHHSSRRHRDEFRERDRDSFRERDRDSFRERDRDNYRDKDRDNYSETRKQEPSKRNFEKPPIQFNIADWQKPINSPGAGSLISRNTSSPSITEKPAPNSSPLNLRTVSDPFPNRPPPKQNVLESQQLLLPKPKEKKPDVPKIEETTEIVFSKSKKKRQLTFPPLEGEYSTRIVSVSDSKPKNKPSKIENKPSKIENKPKPIENKTSNKKPTVQNRPNSNIPKTDVDKWFDEKCFVNDEIIRHKRKFDTPSDLSSEFLQFLHKFKFTSVFTQKGWQNHPGPLVEKIGEADFNCFCTSKPFEDSLIVSVDDPLYYDSNPITGEQVPTEIDKYTTLKEKYQL